MSNTKSKPSAIGNFSLRHRLGAVLLLGVACQSWALDENFIYTAKVNSATQMQWRCTADNGLFTLKLSGDLDGLEMDISGSINVDGQNYRYGLKGEGRAYGSGYDVIVKFPNPHYSRQETLPNGEWMTISEIELEIYSTGGENIAMRGKSESDGSSISYYCNQ